MLDQRLDADEVSDQQDRLDAHEESAGVVEKSCVEERDHGAETAPEQTDVLGEPGVIACDDPADDVAKAPASIEWE